MRQNIRGERYSNQFKKLYIVFIVLKFTVPVFNERKDVFKF